MQGLDFKERIKVLRMGHEIIDIKKFDKGPNAIAGLLLKWNSFLTVTFGQRKSQLAQAQQRDADGNFKPDPLAQAYIDRVKAIDETLEKIGESLSVNIEEAERYTRELVRIASFDEQKYDECDSNINDYFATEEGAVALARSKKGEKVVYPQEIAEQMAFIETAKDVANAAANIYMARSSTFRENRAPFILRTLEIEQGANVYNRPNTGLYRFLRIEDLSDVDAFGMPNYIFKHGFAPLLIRKYAFHQGAGLLNMPHICHSKNCDDPARYGWTSGGISTTANATHAIVHEFVGSVPTENGVLFLIRAADGRALCIGQFIDCNTGYDGNSHAKRSNAEDAMEYFFSLIKPEEVFAARICRDGVYSDVIWNPNRVGYIVRDIEMEKFLQCRSKLEGKILAYLDRSAPQLKHPESYPTYEMDMANIMQDFDTERLEELRILARRSRESSKIQAQNMGYADDTQLHLIEDKSNKDPLKITSKNYDTVRRMTLSGIRQTMSGFMYNLYREHLVESIQDSFQPPMMSQELVEQAMASLYTEEELRGIERASQEPSVIEGLAISVKGFLNPVPPDHKSHFECSKRNKEAHGRSFTERALEYVMSRGCELTGRSFIHERGIAAQSICSKGGAKVVSTLVTLGLFALVDQATKNERTNVSSAERNKTFDSEDTAAIEKQVTTSMYNPV